MRRLMALLGCSTLALLAGCSGSPSSGSNGGANPAGTLPPPVDESDPKAFEKAGRKLAQNIAVGEVAVFQTVKVTVAQEGSAIEERNAPIIAGKEALIRAYVAPGEGWTAKSITGELRLYADGQSFPVMREKKMIRRASTDQIADSTFNFRVAAENMVAGVTFAVSLIDETAENTKAGDLGSQYPSSGEPTDLFVEEIGNLKLVLVPIKYSTYSPDTSEKQIDLYRSTMKTMYPTADVEIELHEPITYSDAFDLGNMLEEVLSLRQRERAAKDVYYYGITNPTRSFREYCSNGCVAGLTFQNASANRSSAQLRASIGLGFSGRDAAMTMAHEIGHAHGRAHSPCGGAARPDPSYPYPRASIGVWGFDAVQTLNEALISPDEFTDIMGYCPNQWISDYTYKKLFETMRAISQGRARVMGAPSSQAFRMVRVGANGELSWRSSIRVEEPAISAPGDVSTRDVRYLDANGRVVREKAATFYPYDHLPGGVALVPEDDGLDYTSISISGFPQYLAR